MPRLRQIAIATLLGGAAATASASPAVAQGAAPRDSTAAPGTYVVRKGDTLWDLARTYLGDAHRWETLYRLNLGVVLNPHWIEPGMVLRLSATAAAGNAKAAPKAPSRVAAPAAITDVRISTPTEPTQSIVIAAAETTATAGVTAPASAARSTSPRGTAVRPGDHLAAPYAAPLGGPTGTGRIDGVVGTSLIAATPQLRSIQYRDRVRVALPKGATGARGEQLLLIRLAEILGKDAQVVLPVGVVTLTGAATNGVAEAELTRKFDDVVIGQPVILLDTLAMPTGVTPVATTFGPVSRVRWIAGNSALSAPGQFLILQAGSADGLVPGDQLSLRDEAAGDVEVAVVQVTRVTERGSSAIVMQVRQGGVSVGMRARVSAKMP